MNTQPLILVVDDESSIVTTLKEILEDEGYRVETLSNGSKTVEKIGQLIPDLVLLDIFMPNCNGITLLEQIKKEYPNQKVMMISGFGNISIAIESVKKGAVDFIEKPLNIDEILSKINFLKDKKTKNKLSAEEIQINNLEKLGVIGKSYLFLELIHQINQIKNLNYPLLIYGEHGTGKTLLAKYIHKNSNLKDYEFVTVNCSTLQEKNIITKAENFFEDKKGILYIKHINNLSFTVQKNLLNLLDRYKNQEQKIIASSTVPLFKLVQAGVFNSSLFHKLNITPIEVPSLNKRKYDIPLLCDYFLKKENQKHKKSIALNTKSLRLLRNHHWQGNVTQLKNTISQIVSLSEKDDNVINVTDIINFLGEKQTQLIEEQSFLRFSSLKEAKNEFEKKFLIYLLKKNKYDIKQISDRLDLTPIQLRDKLLKFNIEIKQT
ncbi:response regulator [Candidatus Dependentiae bacterium]|nr:response regulator [Candidatus Dependentiae bacterium]